MGSQMNSMDTDTTNRVMSLTAGLNRVRVPFHQGGGCWIVRVIPGPLGDRDSAVAQAWPGGGRE